MVSWSVQKIYSESGFVIEPPDYDYIDQMKIRTDIVEYIKFIKSRPSFLRDFNLCIYYYEFGTEEGFSE